MVKLDLGQAGQQRGASGAGIGRLRVAAASRDAVLRSVQQANAKALEQTEG